MNAYYSSSLAGFLNAQDEAVLGKLAENSLFPIELDQRNAWSQQIELLKEPLNPWSNQGHVFFEFVVPRMGRRIDVLVIIQNAIFVIEFKVGESHFTRHALDQVWDYALDLKNFHEPSHSTTIVPVLVATEARQAELQVATSHHNDGVLFPVKATPSQIKDCIQQALLLADGPNIDPNAWVEGRYKPTPTIVEAATALYGRHSVADLSRSDADAKNLSLTAAAVDQLIHRAKFHRKKTICFITGVPGAGKTLVGLDIATKHMDAKNELHSVYLSGNGPLVKILCEALTRDEVARGKSKNLKLRVGEVRKAVEAFIQNVHHFRDAYLEDPSAPSDHVVIFDEAQRAWTLEQTTTFMARKKGRPNFNRSEPEFLISCMDRHDDWAVVVCLVGGGQEINTGEAGIGEWLTAVKQHFPTWEVHVSPNLSDGEYAADEAIRALQSRVTVVLNEDLHLSVSMRSFRAEHVSAFVKHLLDRDIASARATFDSVCARYPIAITRDLAAAKNWLKEKARGSERYGIVVSSQAERLKPHAINVRSPMDPIHWFLDNKDDVRSSFYLEDVATEFHVQGLELDWACVVWDADLRVGPSGWSHHQFVGNKWQRINKTERQTYLKNAYRVLLTRARQGMVIVVPAGDQDDPTRDSAFYDPIFDYLCQIGLPVI